MLVPFIGFNWISHMRFTWVMDHFLYIAMIGPIGLVVASVDAFLRRDSVLRHAIVSFAAALVVFVLGGQSRAFAAQWRDGETLWTYTVNHAPSIWLPHYKMCIRDSETVGLDEPKLGVLGYQADADLEKDE